MKKSNTKNKATSKAAKLVTTRGPLKADRCAVCNFEISYARPGLSLRANLPICCWCAGAPQFTPSQKLPVAPLAGLSDIEAMGAFYKFADDLQQHHLNFLTQFHKLKREYSGALPCGLASWAAGRLFDGDAQGNMVSLLWEITAWAAVADALAPSLCAVDALRLTWAPAAVRAALNEPDIAPVFAAWYAAMEPYRETGEIGDWAAWGEHYQGECRAFDK
jgi:hypothetical protein